MRKIVVGKMTKGKYVPYLALRQNYNINRNNIRSGVQSAQLWKIKTMNPWWIFCYYYSPIYRSCGELFPVTKEVPSTTPGNIHCRIKQRKTVVTAGGEPGHRSRYLSPIYRSCGELFPVTKEVPSTTPWNIHCRIKQRKTFVTVRSSLWPCVIHFLWIHVKTPPLPKRPHFLPKRPRFFLPKRPHYFFRNYFTKTPPLFYCQNGTFNIFFYSNDDIMCDIL